MLHPPPQVAAPSCAADALAMVEAGWDFFNRADQGDLPAITLGECLARWPRIEARQMAALARIAGAFEAAQGPQADGQCSLVSWLVRFGRVTRAAARALQARIRRLRGHHLVAASLADGAISVSYAEWIVEVVGRFPADDRGTVEQILVDAAAGGALIEDLADLAARMFRLLVPDGEHDTEERHDADRRVTLGRTLGGVGRLNGDLTRHVTALAEQVINTLAVKKGPEDTRTAPQRRHDALGEAFTRLLESGLLPDRGGCKPQVRVDIPLSILRKMRGAPETEAQWVRDKAADLARTRMATRTATHNGNDAGQASAPDTSTPGTSTADTSTPGTSTADATTPDTTTPDTATAGGGNRTGGDPPTHIPHGVDATEGQVRDSGGLPDEAADPGGLSGVASLAGVGPISDGLADALSCDSVLTPTVTGNVDPQALEAMADHWLSAFGPVGRPQCPSGGGCGCGCHRPISTHTRHRLTQTLLRWAIQVVSGPDGIASYLRRTLPDPAINTTSIVLDVGADARTVPAALERAVRGRDRNCRFPGCDHPAELSQVHHIVHRAHRGSTSLDNLLTLCGFHHLTAVHTWGWKIRLNPDGTTTATSPEGIDLNDNGPPGTRPPRWAA